VHQRYILEKDMSKLKLLYFGNTHQGLIKKSTKQLDNVLFVERPNFDFFRKAIQNGEQTVVCFFDEDTSDQKQLQDKMAQLATRSPFGMITVLSSNQKPDKIGDQLIDYLPTPLVEWKIAQSVLSFKSRILTLRQLKDANNKLSSQGQELVELTNIGVALSSERDPDALLEMILTKAREITSADAGSLYLVEKNPEIKAEENNFWVDKQLRFKLAQNDSITASYQEFVMPAAKKSMAGFTALTGKPVNIEDAYHIPKESEFQHNRSFDEKMGYRTKSVLCIPMLSHQGEMIGLLQLINRKKKWGQKLDVKSIEKEVFAFDDRCEGLASSLASQAAVSIDNVKLYEEIQRLIEGFIVASVHAIEQRDPTTSGHSERVAELTVGLAKKIDLIDRGPYKNTKFTRDDIQQIKYAALLHDFGKIGVREHVLIKAKKLYPEQLDVVKWRFKFIKKSLELDFSQKKLEKLLQKSRESISIKMGKVDSDFEQYVKEVDDFMQFVLKANEPRLLSEGGQDKLFEIAELMYQDNGYTRPFLEKDEINLLSIPRGSLSQEERVEIESHVTHTFNFLNRIPWASHLKAVPQIAYAHHEKLDGSGYPRKLASAEIPVPSKMMTIADIYDALTASDRPYKKSVPSEKALEILGYEEKEGKIDPELYRVFIDAQVYNINSMPDL
jgi:HD-GYP domain-containing protein (c-di-GMP phosphodiesterase class II)